MRPRPAVPVGLRALPALGSCPPHDLAALAAHAEVVRLVPGATVVGPCRRAREVVVVLAGEVQAESPDVTAGPGAVLGADEVERGDGFAIRWRARTAVDVLVLPAAAYRFGLAAARAAGPTRRRPQRRRGRIGAAISAGSARQSTPGTSM